MIQTWWWSRSSDADEMIQTWWLSRSSDDPVVMMIQTRWWSRSSDDPDVMMIQTWWRSRSSDDLDVMMIQQWCSNSRDDPNPVMKKSWRRRLLKRRLEYEDNMKMTRWSSWYREEDECWKLCRENTFLVKKECWWICNFEMYSLVFLMYCTPMFILRCVCNVIESCHAPMFRSGGSIM